MFSLLYPSHYVKCLGLLAPCLQIFIELLPSCMRLRRRANLVRQKVLAHDESKSASELFSLRKARAARNHLAWLEMEGVLAIEDTSYAPAPLEFAGRVFLRMY